MSIHKLGVQLTSLALGAGTRTRFDLCATDETGRGKRFWQQESHGSHSMVRWPSRS